MVSYSVILADDHVLVRQGLRRLLEGIDDQEVVGEVNDGLDPPTYKTITPQMVILDIFMPTYGGLKLLPRSR